MSAALGRAFLAVVPPPEALDALDDLAAGARGHLPPGARVAGREAWHVTVRFLGAVPALDPLVEGLGRLLAPGPVPGPAGPGAPGPFVARLGGGGAFPSPRRATVLWVGLAAGDAGLHALAAAVGGAPRDDAVATSGVVAGGLGPGGGPGGGALGGGAPGGAADPLAGLVAQAPERRPYRPHVTLARSARPRDLRRAVAALDEGPPGPPFAVGEVVLFESVTARDGARHTVRARFPLA